MDYWAFWAFIAFAFFCLNMLSNIGRQIYYLRRDFNSRMPCKHQWVATGELHDECTVCGARSL